MPGTIMVAFHCFILFQSYGLLIFLLLFLCNFHSCSHHNSVAVYRNVYQVKIMCHVQLRLLSVSELLPFGCVFMLILYNLHSYTRQI